MANIITQYIVAVYCTTCQAMVVGQTDTLSTAETFVCPAHPEAEHTARTLQGIVDVIV